MNSIMNECFGLFSMGDIMRNTSELGVEHNMSGTLGDTSNEVDDPYKVTVGNVSRANPSGLMNEYGFVDYVGLTTVQPYNDTLMVMPLGEQGTLR